jgi:hypothetical protein
MFFKKKKVEEPPLFLSIHEKLIKSIKDDIESWQTTKQFSEGKVYPVFVIFNSFAFYRLSFLDIAVLFKSFLINTDEIEKKVYAKLLSLNIYEFLEDLPKIFGKEFGNSLFFLKNDKLIEDIKIIKKEIHKIKSENQDYLKEIRNSISAHKDHNTITQIAALETLNIEKIFLTCLKIFLLYNMIHSFEIRLINVAKESNEAGKLKEMNGS